MTAVFLVLLILLVLVNGVFVAAEFALVRTRKGRIEALAKEGESGAEQALEQIETIDESLAACQVGITLASIGIGFLGEPAIASADQAGARRRHRGATAIAFAISFLIATSLHITIGEQVPKMLAISNAGSGRARPRPPAALVRADQRSVHASPSAGSRMGSCACSASTRSDLSEKHTSGGPQGDHPDVGARAARSTPARR